jgi:hypothetical protein
MTRDEQIALASKLDDSVVILEVIKRMTTSKHPALWHFATPPLCIRHYGRWDLAALAQLHQLLLQAESPAPKPKANRKAIIVKFATE